MQNIDSQCKPAQSELSAEEIKQRRKENRAKFLDRIRDSLGSITQQLALSPAEAAIASGRSPTWAYRKIYDGTFRVISSGGRLMIPRAEIERYIARADKYDPQPKEGGVQNGNDNT
jgi:hypothetical protein